MLAVSNLPQMSAANISCDLKSWKNVVFQTKAAKRHITEIVRMCLLASESREIEIMSKDWNLAEIGYDIPWMTAERRINARISNSLQIFAKIWVSK